MWSTIGLGFGALTERAANDKQGRSALQDSGALGAAARLGLGVMRGDAAKG